MTAPVVLSDYDPAWPAMFEQEKTLLFSLIGSWMFGGVEHVGSTAVPGMVAKPVIDVMFGVRSLADSRPAIAVLEANGYDYSPYKEDVMHWFCKPSSAHRTHHLHLVPFGSRLWTERLAFRERLRSDAQIAGDYARLKRDLADQFRNDREAYTQAKWPFIAASLSS